MNSNQPSLLFCSLEKLEARPKSPSKGDRLMEFHVHASIRALLGMDSSLFKTTGNLIIPDFSTARSFADRLRSKSNIGGQDTSRLSAGKLNAMGLIDEILHTVLRIYRERASADILSTLTVRALGEVGKKEYDGLLSEFTREFPSSEVYRGTASAEDWLAASTKTEGSGVSVSNSHLALEELILLKLANENPAFSPFRFLFDDGEREKGKVQGSLSAKTCYDEVFAALEAAGKKAPGLLVDGKAISLFDLLRMPARQAPVSLEAQLLWIREHWGVNLGEIGAKILSSLDLIEEEERPRFPPGPGPAVAYTYTSARSEYEKFSQDRDWMPSTVLIAKNILVWLHQLSVQYGAAIARLDQIPDRELEILASRGINGLWLIGIWQRSAASEKIKRACGNPEAAASAYSLFDYEIEPALGGWDALDTLRERCMWRGIRLAADMVPNHTGIDSEWVRRRPDLFMGLDHCPFTGYTFYGPDLSEDPSIGIWLEDHYYSRTDAAVVFKRIDRNSGKVRYIYHGNDGTGMAWNDTAQIDFLNPEARAAVKERILHVARHFSIIRFDAAMVLARQHIRRLWYPAPGSGGAIPSRAEHALSDETFDQAMPAEFWREVVDECAQKAPDTLLLAEAFWMMEGYFVRTLGMHRVYNSAFMNMLKEEKNSLYRLTVKNTQEFDKQILKRFVNFMSNPDEETAIAQFGSGNKYFGVCTMMATMPGLPMFGHGQIEGLTEKYGMEYRRSYKDEKPNQALVARHEREIFPLLRTRKLFAEVDQFCIFDFRTEDGHVDENVFAYSNGIGPAKALVFFNNHWERTKGKIELSAPFIKKGGSGSNALRRKNLAEALEFDTGPGNYLSARELKSGLWRVFDCRELGSSGWKVELEGFQTLVFTDFTKVFDLDGTYRRLYESLDGRPVADLDDALEEAARPELYHALQLSVDALDEFASALCESPKRDIAALAKKAGTQAELFFSWLSQALSEDEGPRPGISSVVESRKALEEGLASLAVLAGDARVGVAGPGIAEYGVNPPFEAGSTTLGFQFLLSTSQGAGTLVQYLFILVLAVLVPDANRSEELRYILEKYLIKKRLSRTPTDGLVFAFASRPKDSIRGLAAEGAQKRSLLSSARERAAELVRWASGDEEAKTALGINAWEGKVYFNAERFDAMLDLWPCFAFLEESMRPKGTGLAGAASMDWIREIRDLTRAAVKGSDYLVERLLANIEGTPEA
ncbi:MAG: alpha-amylase family glycosyl hydrolase [Spirochaetes bacterium]|nr:alpha-amylase family glycosyl hydrolase [Spirochaetota bacterium]